MPQKDFILRVIEEAVEMIAQILGLRDAGRPERALQLVDRTARRFIGLDLEQLDRLPYPALRELLSVGGQLDLPRYLLLAELRRLKGEISDELHGPGAGRRESVLSLRLFLDVAESRGLAGLGDYGPQLDRVAARLQTEGPADEETSSLMRRLEALRVSEEQRSPENRPENPVP
jgi:hypothetical protein